MSANSLENKLKNTTKLLGSDNLIRTMAVIIAAMFSFLSTYIFNAVGELQGRSESQEQQIIYVMKENENLRREIKEDIQDIKDIQSKILGKIISSEKN